MKNPFRLAIPAMLCCAVVATPALASPTGTITSGIYSVTQPTHVYPGSSPMLNLTVKCTIHNPDPAVSYFNVRGHLTFYNGTADAGALPADQFAIAGGQAAFYNTTRWDNMCSADPTITPSTDITLLGAADAYEAYFTLLDNIQEGYPQ